MGVIGLWRGRDGKKEGEQRKKKYISMKIIKKCNKRDLFKILGNWNKANQNYF